MTTTKAYVGTYLCLFPRLDKYKLGGKWVSSFYKFIRGYT